MKIALYLRVSTREQTENYSLSNQEDRMKAFCKAKEWSVYEVYSDGGYSGADTDRPDLQRMLKDLKKKKFDAVMVYKLDRLSRSQRDTLILIEDHFIKSDIDFISVTESLDTSTPMGRAMIGIMSSFAQLEREIIAERMRDGQIKRAQEGFAAMGGDYNPAGFIRKDGELITNEEEKRHVQEAFKIYSELHSITKMQNELKVKGYTVWRFRRYRDILENPLYNGKVRHSGEVYPGRHEKFINDDLFNYVQKLLKRNRGHNFNKPKESLLSGLISCSKCGERYLTVTSTEKRKDKTYKYRYYICKARRFPVEFPEKCHNKIWNAKNLEKLVRAEMQLLSTHKEKDGPKEKIDYTQLLNNINARIERIIDLYADGSIDKDILDRRMRDYNKEKETLLARKDAQEESLKSPIDNIEDHVISLKKADFPARRAIVDKFISQIFIDGDNVSIEWNF